MMGRGAKPLDPTVRRRGRLDRFLSIFSDVRFGEGGGALLLAANVFVLLTTYYIIKPVREALILTGGGAEVKSYAAAGQALLLLGAVPLYGWLAARLPRSALIRVVTLFFAACLVLFYLLARTGAPLGVVFFLWVGIFNLMVVAQFWAFANDLYTPEEGQRLFPIVAFGASSGAVFGSFLTGRLVGIAGIYPLLLLAAGLLGCSLLLTSAADARARRGRSTASARDRVQEGRASVTGGSDADTPIGKGNAFKLVLRSHYLLAIALLILLLNWVNTTGEYILGRTVVRAATEAAAGGADAREFIGKFYSDFFAVVNLTGMLVQLFLVSRILKWFGVRVALLVLPVLAMGGYALLAFFPVLSVVRWAKTAENATDYSLQNTVRNILFLTTTREEKYKAKQVVDTFCVRTGDVLSAALVWAGTHWLAFRTEHFAMWNLALAALWFAVASYVGLSYRRRTSGRDITASAVAPVRPAETPSGSLPG